jgi:hypothetical protein
MSACSSNACFFPVFLALALLDLSVLAPIDSAMAGSEAGVGNMDGIYQSKFCQNLSHNGN